MIFNATFNVTFNATNPRYTILLVKISDEMCNITPRSGVMISTINIIINSNKRDQSLCAHLPQYRHQIFHSHVINLSIIPKKDKLILTKK